MKINCENPGDEFEYLFPKGKVWFTPREVGEIIGRSDQFVRNGFHSGKIMGHQASGAYCKNGEKKMYMRVHKKMLVMYLLETTNYTSDIFLERLKYLLQCCGNYELFVLEKFIRDLLDGNIRK